MTPVPSCERCRCDLSPEDAFCVSCGERAPGGPPPRPLPGSVVRFGCLGCGASMSFDPEVGNLYCPFCGEPQVESRGPAPALEPARVLPFEISRDAALDRLHAWLGSRFWAPRNLRFTTRIESFRPVSLPCWVFEAEAHSYWAADSSRTPSGAKAEWTPVSGEHRGSYRDLYVPASGALTGPEIAALLPFDLSRSSPAPDPTPELVQETFGFGRRYARGLVQNLLQERVRADCARQVPGRHRNLRVRTRVEGLRSEAVRVPVWIVGCLHRGRPFRILVHGQTGEVSGSAPVSPWKLALLLGLILLILGCALR